MALQVLTLCRAIYSRGMSEEKKIGVSVITSRASDNFYEAGRSVRVSDGHLIVLNGRGNTADPVAIHAPGDWVRAEVIQ